MNFTNITTLNFTELAKPEVITIDYSFIDHRALLFALLLLTIQGLRFAYSKTLINKYESKKLSESDFAKKISYVEFFDYICIVPVFFLIFYALHLF